MTQQFEIVTVGLIGKALNNITAVESPVKENRLTTLKTYLAAEEKSADRSQLYDLKDSIQRLEGNKQFKTEDNKKALDAALRLLAD